MRALLTYMNIHEGMH